MSIMKKVLTLFVLSVLSVCILGACSQSRSKTYEGDIDGKHVLTTLTYKKMTLHTTKGSARYRSKQYK